MTTAITNSARSLRASDRHWSGSSRRTAPVTMIAASVASGEADQEDTARDASQLRQLEPAHPGDRELRQTGRNRSSDVDAVRGEVQ
ncbi:MAG TPA: hypothetical protein VFH23_09315 [Jiangellaceae bacterium]|nr:hypothetical protein [Jiangellaceae bacterium]